jgi:hypothetical protein
MIQNNQLVTKEELRRYLNWNESSSSAESDDLFDQIINSASDIIEHYCNTKIKLSEVTETVSGNGSDRLFMSNSHITKITNCKYWNGSAFTDYYTPGEIEQCLFSSLHVIYNRAQNFEEGIFNFQFTYTCGFDPVPEDLKLICLELCTVLFNNSSFGDFRVGLISNQQGTYKMYFLDELPRHKNVINKYRLINI